MTRSHKKTPGRNLPTVSRLTDLSTGKDVAFIRLPKTDDRGHTHSIVAMDDFLKPVSLKRRLLTDGADQSQFEAEELIKALPQEAGILTSRTGWLAYKGTYRYMLYRPIVQLNRNRLAVLKDMQHEAGIGIGEISGSLRGWVNRVATPTVRSKPGLFALCAGFAGPLLAYANLTETMVINFAAKSSTGKSTIVRAASSIFGNPANYPGWNLTETRMYECATAYNDNTLIFDDLEATKGTLQERMCRAYEMIHILTNGKPKRVASHVASSMQQQRFRCLALSSSPTPIQWSLANHVDFKDSDRVRLLEVIIPETPSGIWDPSVAIKAIPHKRMGQETERLNESLSRFYGCAGKKWIHFLNGKQSELENITNAEIARFCEHLPGRHAQKRRIALKVGTIAAAGILAVRENLLPCNEDDVLAACLWAYDTIIETAYGVEMAPSCIESYLATKVLDTKRFRTYRQSQIRRDAELKKLAGFINGDRQMLILVPAAFEELFADFMPKIQAARSKVLSDIKVCLIDRGVIQPDCQGKPIKSFKIAGSGQRRMVLDLKRLEELRQSMACNESSPSSGSRVAGDEARGLGDAGVAGGSERSKPKSKKSAATRCRPGQKRRDRPTSKPKRGKPNPRAST